MRAQCRCGQAENSKCTVWFVPSHKCGVIGLSKISCDGNCFVTYTAVLTCNEYMIQPK